MLASAISSMTYMMPLMPAAAYTGTDITSDAKTVSICISARWRSLRAPFSMAVSPPVTAIIATTGARAIISAVCPPPSNTQRSNAGAAAMHTAAPSSAVTMLHALTVATKELMRLSSPLSIISERCFTALNDMPRLVA